MRFPRAAARPIAFIGRSISVVMYRWHARGPWYELTSARLCKTSRWCSLWHRWRAFGEQGRFPPKFYGIWIGITADGGIVFQQMAPGSRPIVLRRDPKPRSRPASG